LKFSNALLRCRRSSLTACSKRTWKLECLKVHIKSIRRIMKDLVPCKSFAEVVISTDACLTGGAAYYNTDWFYVNWMIDFPSVSDVHINLKELFTVLLALRRWGHKWKNTYVHIKSIRRIMKDLVPCKSFAAQLSIPIICCNWRFVAFFLCNHSLISVLSSYASYRLDVYF
jgi:hypothetical protein